MLRNLESAGIKARRYGLAPRRIAAFLKRQNFDTEGMEAKGLGIRRARRFPHFCNRVIMNALLFISTLIIHICVSPRK